MVKVAKLHTKWYSSFFLFEVGSEKRVKNTRTNERKSSFLLKKKRKKRSQSSSLKLFLKESLCLCVSVSLSRVRVRERRRESVGRGTSKGLTRVALCFIAAFRGSRLGFESV